jgi:hypothetical protein
MKMASTIPDSMSMLEIQKFKDMLEKEHTIAMQRMAGAYHSGTIAVGKPATMSKFTRDYTLKEQAFDAALTIYRQMEELQALGDIEGYMSKFEELRKLFSKYMPGSEYRYDSEDVGAGFGVSGT